MALLRVTLDAHSGFWPNFARSLQALSAPRKSSYRPRSTCPPPCSGGAFPRNQSCGSAFSRWACRRCLEPVPFGLICCWARTSGRRASHRKAHSSPAPHARGFFCGWALCNQPPAAPLRAGLSANLLGVARNLLMDGCSPGKPTLPLRRMPRADSAEPSCRRRGRLLGRGRAPVRVPASGNGLHRRFARSLNAMPRMAAVTTKRKTDRPEPRFVRPPRSAMRPIISAFAITSYWFAWCWLCVPERAGNSLGLFIVPLCPLDDRTFGRDNGTLPSLMPCSVGSPSASGPYTLTCSISDGWGALFEREIFQ
jgi:hypothetical protein